MPKVLMVSQPSVAGVAQCVLDWSVGLRHRGWDVQVAAPAEGDLLPWCEQGGIPATAWESVRSPYAQLLPETNTLRHIIRGSRPDIVVLHSSKAGLDGRLVLRGSLPTVFVPHAWSFDAATGAAGTAALQWERFAARRWTDAIICVSSAEFRRGVAAKIRADYHVARNGVNISAVTAALGGQPRSTIRADLGLSPQDRVAVCVGRLAPQKGQDVLIKAWSGVSGPDDRRLVLVGDGPDEDMLRSRATDDSSITFTGGVDRPTALRWLAAGDVVVVPSRWEGMALVPLEALAVGTPVVASDVTGISEAISTDVGTLVPPDDPAALAAALGSWLTRPDAELTHVRHLAAVIAERDFSMTATVDAVNDALTSCLAKASA